MPGLSGVLLRKDVDIDISTIIQRMLDKQLHRSVLKLDKWVNTFFAGGRVHLGIYETGDVPIINERYVFLFDGEIYNFQELINKYNLGYADWSSKKHAQFVFDLYIFTGSWDFLTDLDGIFAMALFDKREKTISLVSDRLGLRPIYYWVSTELFAFSAEIKSLLELPGIPLDINRLALEEFVAYGYMLNDHTWFDCVKVLEPGTILTASQVEVFQSQYWTWKDIQSIPTPVISMKEAAIEMGEIFQRAVEKRIASDHKYSITLSGGLDSRALLAAIPDHKLPVPCLTFGREDCGNIRYASEVAKLKKCPHYIVPVDGKEDWLPQQEWVVWLTDGLANMLSLVGRYMSPILSSYSNIMLNGYIGDTLTRGTYGSLYSSEEEIFKKKFHITVTGFDGATHMIDTWRESNLEIEHFFEYQRARRYILMGSVQHSVYLEQRKPFVDKDFIEFSMGLPKQYRCSEIVGKSMLLNRYPQFFKRIPYELTGVSISASNLCQKLGMIKLGAYRRIGRNMPGTLKFTPRYETLAYNTWLRKRNTRSFIREKLLEGDRYIYNFIKPDIIKMICERHFSGNSNNQKLIGRFLTMETYFQFVFDGKIPSEASIPRYVLNDYSLS